MARDPLQALVDHYLTDWGSSAWGHSFHSLVELGPGILPLLEERFLDSREPGRRAEIVEIARAQRAPRALALFELALADPSPQVWKAALDGLVALASDPALRALEAALAAAPPGGAEAEDYRAWLEEALLQARAARGQPEEDAG